MDFSAPLVSIIVPVYKTPEKLLKHSILSLARQDYKKVEIIIVDDGSPDQCGEICDKIANMNHNMTVIHTENYGVSHARNTGLDKATGKYVIFVDADDYVTESFVTELVEVAESTKSELVMCNFSTQSQPNRSKGQIYHFTNAKDLLTIRKSFIGGESILGLNITGSPWAKLYLLQTLKENNCKFDETLPRSQDNEFNFRFMKYVKKCLYLDKCLYVYNVHENSAMRKYWKNGIKNAEILLYKILSDIRETENPYEYKEAFAQFTFSKYEDILYTTIMHKQNPITFSQRFKKMKELAKSKYYYNSIQSIKLKNPFSYRSLLILFFKKKQYLLAYLLIRLRLTIKYWIV